MPPNNYAAPLSLEPRLSRRLAGLFALGVTGALLLPLSVAMSGGLRVAMVLATLGLALQGYRGVFGDRRITRAVWDETGAWQVELADGTAVEAELAGDSFVSPGVMVLGFRVAARRLHLVILSDTLDAETRRRLRVRLRLEGAVQPERG